MENNPHILIVEDSPTQAALLEEALRVRGYQTQIVANGSLALEAVRRQRPAVIVSDVRMPVMDGFQLCRAVKQDPELDRIPVILLTAMTTSMDVLASLEAGADFYLPKPYQDDYLAAKIAEVLSRCGEDEREPLETDRSDTLRRTAHQISVTHEHMVRLLMSTYEVSIQQNQELLRMQEELQTLNETLEEKVRDRTVSLTAEIIERQRAEKELEEKNAELAKLNNLKNHFLGTAAHDLRHPLGIIATCSQFLLKEAAGSLGQQHLQFVEFIETSSSFMLSLLSNLLDFAKIEVGKLDLDMQPTDLVDLIHRVAALNQILADRKGIQIRVLDSEPVPPVSLDAMKMEQVLNNLISNAVKFSASGTTVSIQVGSCGDRVTVSVSDQGPGIPEEDQAKLFQPFSRISVRSPDGQKSTGLGLAIVRKIVIGHQGEIWVDSEVGRGSTFHFSLPFEQGVVDSEQSAVSSEQLAGSGEHGAAIETATELESARPSIGTEHTILIVEDSLTQAALLAEALRLRGYQTQIAADGSQALAAVRRRRPDMILSDVRMPVMDGFQLCRAVKQDPDLQSIPVVLLTALTTVADVLTSLEAGADFYIPKPYQDNYLAAKISEILVRSGADRRGPPETDQVVTSGETTLRISTTREQMVPLLVSTYEVAMQQNQELLRAQDELQTLNQTLEEKVLERTALLAAEITQREQMRDRELLARRVLELLNRGEHTPDTIRDILQTIRQNTGIEAMGIRLRAGDDFPYFVTSGFAKSFLLAEQFLCMRDGAGEIVRDGEGNPVLECMCGNILRGRTNPALPFFTPGGSFRTNCTTQLLASTIETDRQNPTRNRCHREGYESVAIVPLRADAGIIGLLQLNDHRPNQFSPEIVSFLEGLGASIGIALARTQADERIHEQLDELCRWQDVMLDREDRVREVKREVNELCRRLGETARYPRLEPGAADSETAAAKS